MKRGSTRNGALNYAKNQE